MIEMLIALVLYILVIGLVCWLLLYLIDTVGIPQPFHKVARTAVIVVGVLIVILLLLGLIGVGPSPRLPKL